MKNRLSNYLLITTNIFFGVIMLILISCSSQDSNFEGSWNLFSKGQKVQFLNVKLDPSKQNGKILVSKNGSNYIVKQEESNSINLDGIYTINEKDVLIKTDNSVSMVLSEDGNHLLISINGEPIQEGKRSE